MEESFYPSLMIA